MSDKPKKPQKLKARLPRGLEDRGPAAINATRVMVEKIREVYERYGFEPVETPAMEYTDALGKFLPDQDRPNEGVFSFQDDDEQWISLRYDLTAPLARYVAERYGTENLVLPYRSYRFGYVYRNEKPGPGRFRQFMQFDADTIGTAAGGQSSAAADAEMCMMAADTMEALGIPRGSYVVKVWNRRQLEGILDAGEVWDGAQRLTALRAIDKLDRLGFRAVQQLLATGRKDESGDVTKGANLPVSANNFITYSLTTASINLRYGSSELIPEDEIEKMEAKGQPPFKFDEYRNKVTQYLAGRPTPDSLEQGLSELETIHGLIEKCGYSDRVKIDPTVVRGLEYYTGPVYEVELLLDTKDEKGRPVRFGSVGGGGRYDGLVSRFRGEVVPATGFSIGVSRLQAALTMLGKLDTKPETGPVVVTVFDRDRVADYQKMVASLRGDKIRAELYLGNPKNMGNQLKYADRRNSPCVIIQGSDEKAKGKVQVKDLILGAGLTSTGDRDEYLKKQAEAQVEVDESELVGAVRKILARHAVRWG
jgi:histidyl-tRNA synthetase